MTFETQGAIAENRDSVAFTLPGGTFGTKTLAIETFQAPSSSNLVINVHGAYGSIYSSGDKYLKFARKLQAQNIANVVLYESSRLLQQNADIQKMSFDERRHSFQGKIFEDELGDLKEVIGYVLNKSEQLFKCKKISKLVINGNSLGGILAIALGDYLPEGTIVNTVGTGLFNKDENQKIFTLMPPKEKVLEVASRFHNTINLFYGTQDDLFTPESFAAMVAAVKSKDKQVFKCAGVDHTFALLDGKPSDLPYEKVIEAIKQSCL